MGDGSSVLSQDEVDALFNQATGKDIARPPISRPTPSATSQPPGSPAAPNSRPPQGVPPVKLGAPPPPAPAPAPSPDVLQTLQSTVADLSGRMVKMEAAISGLSQVETGATTDVNVSIQQLPQKLEAMEMNIQGISRQIRGVLIGLEGTPDYDIRQSFICEPCGSHGLVTIPVKCTECGEEGWWGWWPQKG